MNVEESQALEAGLDVALCFRWSLSLCLVAQSRKDWCQFVLHRTDLGSAMKNFLDYGLEMQFYFSIAVLFSND